jgi:streptomycin 6-kinase
LTPWPGSPEIPAGLRAFPERGEDWAAWLDALPRLVRDVLGEWELTPDGPSRHGYCALVVPVVEAGGRRSVVKFGWPHEEVEHEHLGLQAVHGNGMALLYRADPRRHVLLLERLHAERDLRSVEVIEACKIVAGFYRRIHLPALPQLRALSSYIERWAADLAALDTTALIPPRLVDRTLSLARTFVADEETEPVMIHGDLHYENVLAADREPWLVIDPEPMAGDRHYEVAPLLWNRWNEAVATGNAGRATRQRLETVVDVAGLDEDRVKAWVVVRMVYNALWRIQDNPQGLDRKSRDYLTMCVTLAEAMAD